MPELPAAAEAVVLRCLASEPAARLGDLPALGAAVREVLAAR